MLYEELLRLLEQNRYSVTFVQQQDCYQPTLAHQSQTVHRGNNGPLLKVSVLTV